MVKDVFSLFSCLHPGETVLVEYPSEFPSEVLFSKLLVWAEDRGIPVVVDDVLDTFPQYLSRLELRAVNVEGISSIPIIKIGGNWKVGNVVGSVDVDKHSLGTEYYERAYAEITGREFVLNPVLGFHKFFLNLPNRELLRLIRNISTFVGKRDRVAVYFLNVDAVKSGSFYGYYHLLREVSTTLLSIERSGDGYVGRVLKAADDGLMGAKIPLP
ncbi:DUF257 family protein [Thermococcus sp.]